MRLILILVCILILFSCEKVKEREDIDTNLLRIDLSSLPLKYLNEEKHFVDYRIDKNAKDYIIYLLDSDSCVPCINEIIDFEKFLDKNNIQVNQLILLVGENQEKIKRLIRTSEVEFQHVYLNIDYAEELLRFKGDKIVGRQIVFLEPNLTHIYYSSYLTKNDVSPESHKNFLVQEALKNKDKNLN